MRQVFAALLVTGAAVSLAAQDPPRTFETAVNYVRVDMYPLAGDKPVIDLRVDEVELLEDGVPQTIEQFEHVQIALRRPQTLRPEPSTMAEMQRALKDPRARVFVLFLDPRHVDLQGSMNVRRPLIDALNSLIGGDDLIAVMTPEMSARDITFTRRTNNIEEMLSKYWGARELLATRDKTEIEYEACYNVPGGDGLAERMIARRREMVVLDALEGLVEHLRTLREERKAVITISDGWPLYGPDRALARPLVDPKSGTQSTIPLPPVGRDPRTGRPGATDTSTTVVTNDGLGTLDRGRCENDRQMLAEIHSEQRLVSILRGANRANVSFYPIGPGGFADAYRSITTGPARALGMLADITDGQAVVQPHLMESGIRRIVDDLSAYYLLGYYSNAKPDGRFHNIAVRIKRPGVRVRARSGYLAAPASEASRAVVSAASPGGTDMKMMTEALSALSTFSRQLPLRVKAVAAWTPAGVAVIRAVAEVPRANTSGDDWTRGGEAEATLSNGAGKSVATGRASIDPVTLVASIVLTPTPPLAPDDYRLHVRVKGTAALGSTDVTSFTLDAAPLGTGVIFSRRMGTREIPTADLRFRRTERLIVETPAAFGNEVAARLLGRTGDALNVPLTAVIREAADGTRWRRVEITLAPLAVGDYVLETSSGTDRTLTAFRVVP